MTRQRINGVLLIYHHYLQANAATIMEHVNAFEEHSRFKIWKVNSEFGFPKGLNGLEFDVIVLHYSLFGALPYPLDRSFFEYLRSSKAKKVMFFQDEYRHCRARFQFINEIGADCIFTCLEKEYFGAVYGKYTQVPEIRTCLTGYVSDDLRGKARILFKPRHLRRRDVTYRARKLEFYMGRGGQEKHEIGLRFLDMARGLGLKLDIRVDETSRIYGDAWLEFLADSKAVLGVESGVSIFDLEDKVFDACERLLEREPRIKFEEVYERVLKPWEGNVYLRTISPRHFEAAALFAFQVLYEGRYSGILLPHRHYFPLKKDFSNFDEVIRTLKNDSLCAEITHAAYTDLIESDRYTYRVFIQSSFDSLLEAWGLDRSVKPKMSEVVEASIQRGEFARCAKARARATIRTILYSFFPGGPYLVGAARRLIRKVRMR